jgi:peroxiredoxin
MVTRPAHEGSPAEAQPAPQGLGRMTGLGLLVALTLIVAAWFVGGRAGFDQIVQGGINSSRLPKIGDPAPDFVTVLSDGRVVQLSNFYGQPVWLNFWGSWCPPCRSEMPEMEAAYEDLAPRGLVMLAVSLDEPPEAAFTYVQRNGATYLVAADPKRTMTGAAYPISNFPTHILIDRDGIVRDVVLAELDKREFFEHAQTILAAPQVPQQ